MSNPPGFPQHSVRCLRHPTLGTRAGADLCAPGDRIEAPLCFDVVSSREPTPHTPKWEGPMKGRRVSVHAGHSRALHESWGTLSAEASPALLAPPEDTVF